MRSLTLLFLILVSPIIISSNSWGNTAAGAVTVTPTNSGIWVNAEYSGDPDADNMLRIYWKHSSEATWPAVPQYVIAHSASPYIRKIEGLTNSTPYDVRVEFIDAGVTGLNPKDFIRIVPARLLHNSDNATLGQKKWAEEGGWGIPGGKYGVFDCNTCHMRSAPNIKRIKGSLTAQSGNFPGSTVSFQSTYGFGDDGDSHTASIRICEVCHSQTDYHRYDASSQYQKMHYNNTDCAARCHLHRNGFGHGGESGASGDCILCHGHDAGYEYSPGQYSQGKGTSVSHSTHTENDSDDLRGPNTGCGACHDTTNYPYFKSGTDADGDGRFSLPETDVCNDCHSEAGTYKGVSDQNTGAKANWKMGVYESDGRTLKAGRERWCAGCHDEYPALIGGIAAPDVTGNESESYAYGSGWGYYKSGHGLPSEQTYPASGGITAGAGLACTACHDSSSLHIDGNARTFNCSDGCDPSEYRAGYRLITTGGQLPMQVPLSGPANAGDQFRLCYGCHNQGPFTDPGDMNTNFRTDEINRHEYHLNLPHQLRYPADYNYSGMYNSRITCVVCHNVHGSRRPVMINDGSLIGREPGLKIWYRNDDIVQWSPSSPAVPDPENLLLPASTGTLVVYNSSSNLCTHCHGNGNVTGEARTPYQNVQQAPFLEWTGESGYEADGVNPDIGAAAGLFTFRIKYSDANNDAPEAMEVWVDADDSGTYEDGEKYPMSAADPGDRDYTDGKLYERSIQILKAGDNILNCRFNAVSGGTAASGAPASNRTITLLNNRPSVEWAGGDHYMSDGADPDTGGSGSEFIFRVRYKDLDNEPPAVIQLWIDLDDNGIYGPDEIFGMTGIDSSDMTCSDGKLYEKRLAIPYSGDGSLGYRFYAGDGSEDAAGPPASDSVLNVLPSINTPPLLEWAEADCLKEGVRPGTGAVNADFEFRVRYSDADGQCPSYIRVDVNGTQYDLAENDGGSCLTGRTYYRTLLLTTAGNLVYRFSASDGIDDAAGQPAAEHTVNVINTPFRVRPAGGIGWYSTIGAAVSASSDPSVIIVYPDSGFTAASYTESVSLMNRHNRTLMSACGSEFAVISGSVPVTVQTSANIILDGFSFAGGLTYGIYVNGTGNTALHIKNSRVYGNGHGIYINDSDSIPVEIDSVEIFGNSVRGITLVSSDDMANITNSTIHSHNVSGSGAAISMGNSCTVNISGSVIRDNITTGSGGAIYINLGTLTITNSVIAGNRSAANGGAICTNSGPSVSIINSTVADNQANNGGFLYVCTTGTAEIRNSIFWSNLATSGNGANIYKACGSGNIGTISWSDISTASSGSIYNATFTDGEGNITPARDPLFVDPEDRNYHLKTESPCRNAIDHSAYAGPASDMDGNSRPQDTDYDMGAYEYAP